MNALDHLKDSVPIENPNYRDFADVWLEEMEEYPRSSFRDQKTYCYWHVHDGTLVERDPDCDNEIISRGALARARLAERAPRVKPCTLKKASDGELGGVDYE
jgi:hypothetical protein